MNSAILALLFVASLSVVAIEAQIIIGGAALALAKAAKIGFIAGILAGGSRRGGGRRRYGRSVNGEGDLASALYEASIEDVNDCAKRLVCEINAVPEDKLNSMEQEIRQMFGETNGLNLASDVVEFNLAALVGRKVSAAQCGKIYARCEFGKDKLLQILLSEANLL